MIGLLGLLGEITGVRPPQGPATLEEAVQRRLVLRAAMAMGGETRDELRRSQPTLAELDEEIRSNL